MPMPSGVIIPQNKQEALELLFAALELLVNGHNGKFRLNDMDWNIASVVLADTRKFLGPRV